MSTTINETPRQARKRLNRENNLRGYLLTSMSNALKRGVPASSVIMAAELALIDFKEQNPQ